MGTGAFIPKLFNYDGSRNVYCRKCNRLVASTVGDTSFGSCICAICDAAEKGIELSPEIQDALVSSVRLDSGFMAPRFAALPEEKNMPSDSILGKNAKPSSTISHWVKVIKAAVFSVGTKDASEIPLSKQVAKAKKKSRVFALEDNDSGIPTDREF